MARRIVIRRKKPSNVIAMPTVPLPAYYCMWCFTEKLQAKDKCQMCGHFGTTSKLQSEISQVYLSSEAV